MIFIVQEISADFHGKTAKIDERMPLPTVVPLEVTVDFGYGPHLRCCPLPWKQGYTATTFK